jgi:hypothetical protein
MKKEIRFDKITELKYEEEGNESLQLRADFIDQFVD